MKQLARATFGQKSKQLRTKCLKTRFDLYDEEHLKIIQRRSNIKQELWVRENGNGYQTPINYLDHWQEKVKEHINEKSLSDHLTFWKDFENHSKKYDFVSSYIMKFKQEGNARPNKNLQCYFKTENMYRHFVFGIKCRVPFDDHFTCIRGEVIYNDNREMIVLPKEVRGKRHYQINPECPSEDDLLFILQAFNLEMGVESIWFRQKNLLIKMFPLSEIQRVIKSIY